MAWILVSPYERQGFPPAWKSLPVLTTLSSRFSRGTMPALFRMAFYGIYKYPSRHFSWIIHGYVQEFPQKFRLFSYKHKLFSSYVGLT